MDFTELEKIFEDMKEINGLVKESKRRTPGIMNIAEIMRQHRQENEHSDIISFLLDPEEDHNHPEFGTCFLNLLTERGLKIRGKSIKKVTREAVTGAMRRMDIFIETDSEKIIVENKVYSGDQENQLKDYVANAGNPFVVYLTPYGQRPSEYSIPQEKLQDLEKHHRFTCLSYEKDILDWLGRLETKVNEDVLRAAIIQYTDTVKGITNQKKEFNMNQEIAKELYEKYGELSREDLLKKLHAIYECNDNIDLVLFMNLFKDTYVVAEEKAKGKIKLICSGKEWEDVKEWEQAVLNKQDRFGVRCWYDKVEYADLFVMNKKIFVSAGNTERCLEDTNVIEDLNEINNENENSYEFAGAVPGNWIYKAMRDIGNEVDWEKNMGKLSNYVVDKWFAIK